MKSSLLARIPSSRSIATFAMLSVFAVQMELGAQESEFSPASFGIFGSFSGLILAPDDIPSGDEAITVACQGFVETDGTMVDYLCLPNENLAFSDAVVAAVEDQTFVPASTNGAPVRVLMNFAVMFICKAGDCTPIAIRNHGHYFDRYGLAYVAPQPILPTNTWYDGFETKLQWARETLSGTSAAGRWENRRLRWRHGYDVSVAVNRDGTAEDGSIEWRETWTIGSRAGPIGVAVRRALVRAAQTITNVSYIPGFYESEPVEMRLIEYGILSQESRK